MVDSSAEFAPFLTEDSGADVQVSFQETENLPNFSNKSLFNCMNYHVFRCNDGLARVCVGGEPKHSLAVCIQDSSDGTFRVRYLPEFRQNMLTIKQWFGTIPFESILLDYGRFIFHAALISTPFGGILFSGPSGIGKSTQASLWEKLEGSKIINGDKPILGKVDGCWRGFGSPYAGSSAYYVNEDYPIRAIITLAQGPSCSIRRLQFGEAFRKIYSETIINAWNPEYVRIIADYLLDLAMSVPVYHMVCTPDERAVETVKSVLKQG